MKYNVAAILIKKIIKKIKHTKKTFKNVIALSLRKEGALNDWSTILSYLEGLRSVSFFFNNLIHKMPVWICLLVVKQHQRQNIEIGLTYFLKYNDVGPVVATEGLQNTE